MRKLKIMTHVVAGYRDFKETTKLIQIMSNNGADYIEVQIPFSDPIGDGPVITAANHYALAKGANTETSLQFIEKVANTVDTPLLIMTYANIAYRYGLKQFFERAENIGIKAMIIPDLPFGEKHETSEALAYSKEYKISLVPVISPNTSVKRMELIAKELKKAHDPLMVYCTRRTGITGAHKDSADSLASTQDKYIASVEKHFSTQIAAGFGLSSIEQVKALKGTVDIAVIGSHIINLFKEYKQDSTKGLNKVKDFMQGIQST